MPEESIVQKTAENPLTDREFDMPKGVKILEPKEEKKSEDKVIIHTMPKRFYSANTGADKSKNVGIIIIVVGIIFMVAIAGFLYFFLLKPGEEPVAVVTEKPVKPAPERVIPEEEPEEVEPIPEEVEPIPEEEPEIKKEEPLEATTTPEVAIEPVVEIKTAIDTDNDGLTDAEEEALSTIVNLKDSDGDGYDDKAELLGLYNPAGEGSIMINPGIDKYTNTGKGYSLYHLKKMTISKIGSNDDSIMFRFPNGEIIQVVVELNAEKLSIEEWYKKQFNVQSIKNDQRVIKKGWTGIWNEDGLVVYLTHPSNNNIYSLSYSVSSDYVISYKNIFMLMVNSLELK